MFLAKTRFCKRFARCFRMKLHTCKFSEIKPLSHNAVLSCSSADKRFLHSISSPTSSSRHILGKPKDVNLGRISLFGINCVFMPSNIHKNIHTASVRIQPYLKILRVDKPIGTWLLLWPCTWGISLAAEAGHLPDMKLLAMFAAGAFLMRGAGCIINDMWDKDFDKQVFRTKSRPLACGDLTMTQAMSFLAVNLSLSLAILLQLNWYSVCLGAGSLFLVVSYPYMKRITHWPQLSLGLTFNYGVLLGWSAVAGSVDWLTVLPLYFGAVSWTLFYDTIYAHQDKEDDAMIGVKSTALLLGDNTKPWLTAFSGVMLSGLVTTGYLTGQLWPYWIATAATAAHLAYQIKSVDLNDADDCGSTFRSNRWIGAILFAGIVGSKLLQDVDVEHSTKDVNQVNMHSEEAT